MKFDDLLSEADNPKYIDGIYNYCDRWCDRCIFTKQCLNFSMSDNTDEVNDLSNEKFWENLSELLDDTIKFISDRAIEEGYDLNKVVFEIENADELNDKIDQNESVILAKKYSLKTNSWLDKNKLFIEEYEHTLQNSKTFDPFEVIKWYHAQIYVKLKRAYLSLSFDTESEDIPKDSDGSAKVVLIAIDRSLASWGELVTNSLIDDDVALNFLILLDRIKKLIEKDFPDARSFVRPGFDLLN